MTPAEQLAAHLAERPPMPAASGRSVSLVDFARASEALRTWLIKLDRLQFLVDHPDIEPGAASCWELPRVYPKLPELDVPEGLSIDQAPVRRKAPVRPWNKPKDGRP